MTKREARRRWGVANRLARAGETFWSSRMRTLRALRMRDLVHYISPRGIAGPLTFLGCKYAASLALDGVDLDDLP